MSGGQDHPVRDLRGGDLSFFTDALLSVTAAGHLRGYSALTTAIAMMQTSVLPLFHLDRGAAAALLRAYADVMAHPPGDPGHGPAIEAFGRAGNALARAAEAYRSFPEPRGRA